MVLGLSRTLVPASGAGGRGLVCIGVSWVVSAGLWCGGCGGLGVVCLYSIRNAHAPLDMPDSMRCNAGVGDLLAR